MNYLFSGLLLSAALFGCSRPKTTSASSSSAPATHTIAFYNQENLFDTEDDPAIDDAEYLPTSESKWDNEKYQKKLTNMARVISQIGDADGPEILGVCEVENKRVLLDMAKTPALAPQNYQVVHFNSPDARGIDVALLYKKAAFQLTSASLVNVPFPDKTFKTRLPLLVQGTLAGQPVAFVVNHWPSRRGGDAAEANRMRVAQRLRTVLDSLYKREPQRHLLVMGDFNDEPTDKSIQEGLQTARVNTAPGTLGLFNAMAPLDSLGKGSHFYNKEYSMLDQIIMSTNFRDKQDLEYEPASAGIFIQPWMQEPEGTRFAGNPLRTYAGKKYLGGFSDHYPVYIHVTVPGK